MDADEIVRLIRECGALLDGHFLLSSGLHSGNYLQCARVFQHAAFASRLCEALAEKWRSADCDVVVSPALGGVIFGYELSRHLGVRNMFAERENGVMTMRRGFALEPGERALVAEDVVTTGKSVREVIAVCEEAGAEIIGVTSLLDRSDGDVFPDKRFESLLRLDLPKFEPSECPLCAQRAPIVKPGSRTQPIPA